MGGEYDEAAGGKRVRVWCGVRLLQDDDKVLTWIHHVFNRWAGSFGIEADYVAMSNCTVFGIKTEVVLVSTFNHTWKNQFQKDFFRPRMQHHDNWLHCQFSTTRVAGLFSICTLWLCTLILGHLLALVCFDCVIGFTAAYDSSCWLTADNHAEYNPSIWVSEHQTASGAGNTQFWL